MLKNEGAGEEEMLAARNTAAEEVDGEGAADDEEGAVEEEDGEKEAPVLRAKIAPGT